MAPIILWPSRANDMKLAMTMKSAGPAVVFLLAGIAQAQTLSFTFDDGLDPRVQPCAAEWNTSILQALAASRVKAMLLPAGKIVDSPEGMALVEAWARAGHAIGNHTYSHRSLASPRVSLDEFTADVLRSDALLRKLEGWTPRLRFPYLKEGDTEAKRDGMRRWMAANGYRPAPVSIDASDWYYDARFRKWRAAQPHADAKPFREAYLAHIWNRAEYYEGLARKVLDRSPAHVLLLHANAINAAFLPDVLAMFRDKGWKVTDPSTAFADPLYASAPAVLPAGESIVWSLAKQASLPGLRYPAEDDAYEKPLLDAKGL